MLGFVVSDEALSHVLNWILTNKHKTMIKLVLKIRCKGFIYLGGRTSWKRQYCTFAESLGMFMHSVTAGSWDVLGGLLLEGMLFGREGVCKSARYVDSWFGEPQLT